MEAEGIGYAGDSCGLKELGREDVDYRSGFLAFGGITVSRYDDTVELLGGFVNDRLELYGLVFNHGDGKFECLVPNVAEDDRLASNRQIFKQIVARFVGDGANIGAFDLNINKGQVFACFLVKDVSCEVRIILREYRCQRTQEYKNEYRINLFHHC